MKFQQIRSATIKITYDGRTYLIDPWLQPRFMMGSFGLVKVLCAIHRKLDIPEAREVRDHMATMNVDSMKKRWRMMPLKGLPMSVKEVLDGVDTYLVTHVHGDHIGLKLNFKAGDKLKKKTPMVVQSREDKAYMEYSGFKDVRVLEDKMTFGTTEIIRTDCIHGSKIPCGDAVGYIFRNPNEKTLYVCGDTIWYDGVKKVIDTYHPDVIITNNCAADFVEYGRLIMDEKDLAEVVKAAPNAFIIASHMDNVTHATITRKSLKKMLKKMGILDRVHIPEDGEVYTI